MLKRPDYSKPLGPTLEPEFVKFDDLKVEEMTRAMVEEDRQKFVAQFEEIKNKYLKNNLTPCNESEQLR